MNFSPAFHLGLRRVAEELKKPMSQVIEDHLGPVLAAQEQARIKRMYEGLDKLRGISKEPVTDASTTIDDVLYG